MKKFKCKGFIIQSAMVGILLYILLCAIGVVNAPVLFDSGKSDKALSDTATLGGLVSEYDLEIGSYPNSLTDLTKTQGQYGPWIKEVPQDPFIHQDYKYSFNDKGFIVFSVGKDKVVSSDIATGISGDDIGFVGR